MSAHDTMYPSTVICQPFSSCHRNRLPGTQNDVEVVVSNTIGILRTILKTRSRRLLVVEVKGQWHRELYIAASKQLYDRYAKHPDAEQQGIYLVLWFGSDEKVAGKKNTKLETANDLKLSIENKMPVELRGVIDVFVLDLSPMK